MKIALIGHGWLANKFCNYLDEQNEQHNLLLTRRSPFEIAPHTFKNLAVLTSSLELSGQTIHGNKTVLKNLDIIFCFLTPSEDYPQHIHSLLREIPIGVKFILISSTGIFSESGVFNERSQIFPTSSRSKNIFSAEQEVLKKERGQILRSAGQIGVDRQPARSLARKENYAIEDGPVNIIHSDDLVRILALFLDSKIAAKVTHAVSPLHPLKSAYYSSQAKNLGLELPKFKQSSSHKIVNPEVLEEINYKWVNPSCC